MTIVTLTDKEMRFASRALRNHAYGLANPIDGMRQASESYIEALLHVASWLESIEHEAIPTLVPVNQLSLEAAS